MKAFSILPFRFDDDRHHNILAGLRAIGYEVLDFQSWRGKPEPPGKPESELDLLVTWTRHQGGIDTACSKFEAAGGRVLVFEEAFIRHPAGPKTEQYFCASIHDHNGAGVNCPDHGPSRWHGWGLEEKHAWPTLNQERTKILVRQQRGIGSPKVRCPHTNWHLETVRRLQPLLPEFQVIPVEHPKNLKRRGEPVPRPVDQFKDAAFLITWNSHSGAEALLEGVPVIHACPFYFLGGACRHGNIPEFMAAHVRAEIARFELDEEYWAAWHNRRHSTFERYAWCQWSHSELRSGAGLKWLIGK